MLPRVKISFVNGALGGVEPSADSVAGLVVSATAVSGKLELGKAYILYRLDDLKALGVSDVSTDANAFLYKTVKEFYSEVGDGAELWLMCFAQSIKASDMLDKTKDNATKLLKEANGRIRFLLCGYNPSTATSNNTTGIDGDVVKAITNAQALGEWVTEELYAPIFTVIEGRDYDASKITGLPDLTERGDNRVGVLIGDTQESSKGSAIGVLGGRIAKCGVQRHIGRVGDGALKTDEIYIGSLTPKQANIETLNNKGYITFRTFTGKSGYFVTDDCLATGYADDYRSIARRRTIDKAYRIVYSTMLEHINDEIAVTNSGELTASMCKAWEQEIVNAIYNSVTINNELGVDSSDASDKGVKCYIEPKQKVLATNRIELSVQVKPYGYAKYIDINLGFMVTEE